MEGKPLAKHTVVYIPALIVIYVSRTLLNIILLKYSPHSKQQYSYNACNTIHIELCIGSTKKSLI